MKMTLKILIYSIPALLVAYLLFQNTRTILNLQYDINSKTAMFPALTPWNRMSDIKQDQYGQFREVMGYPVNFDIRLPRKFNQVEVRLKYSYPESDSFDFGFAKNSTKTDFETVKVQNMDDDPVADFSTTFDISDTPTPFNKLRFEFLNDNIDNNNFLRIREINLKFTGDKMTIGDVIGKFFNKIGL